MSDEELKIDEATTEEKESGVASTVFRARLVGEPERWIAIKQSPAKRKFSPEPHDILKEIAILSSISHVNINGVIGWNRSGATIEMFTPWIPHNLESLLEIPTFSPSALPSAVRHLVRSTADDLPSRQEVFQVVTKSIVYQIARALDYLHGLQPSVAHRDIKPRNVLLTTAGCVKLIDFGITYHENMSASSDNMWPETKDNMYNDVSTGPFRAPELLFGPKTYDACATDLWSLGCTIAHFFTPIRLIRRSHYSDSDEEDTDKSKSEDDEEKPRAPYLLPKNVDAITFRSVEWMRTPLFEGQRGSIGLAWSIFRLRGTPVADIWPNFDALPDANKVQFRVIPPSSIYIRLPSLPSNTPSTGSQHNPPKERTPTPLDLIHRLLVYPPENRLKASDVIMHPWFTDEDKKEGDPPLLFPSRIYPNAASNKVERDTWKEKSLEQWLTLAFR